MIKITHERDKVVIYFDDGKYVLLPGMARGLATMLVSHADKASIIRGPLNKGRIESEEDSINRLDGVVGDLADLLRVKKP